MNQIFLVGAIFVATTCLITNTPNTTTAYSCSSSSSTPRLSTPTSVSGVSGICSTSSSASISSTRRSVSLTGAVGPNTDTNIGNVLKPVPEATSSSSAGGAQSSCSSSFGGVSTPPPLPIPGSFAISSSTSQSGRCP